LVLTGVVAADFNSEGVCEQRITELPRKQEIVAYCRGPYCVLSFEAVAASRAHGFNVRWFEDGFSRAEGRRRAEEAAP
jgi:rhodanese-related sulfurtransferase